MLQTVVGKVINGRTLKNMSLVTEFTPLKTDISESMVVSDLMANFPPICKKDTLAVQMALLSDHFTQTGEIIGLDEVPEDMLGSKLPVEKGKKAKRNELTQEEYLEAENPPKRPKKEKASEKLKSGASEVPSIQEEAQDLNPEVIIPKKTRSGKAVVSASTTALGQTLQKKKRASKPKKLVESVYVTEEIEGVEAATELVSREVKKKKAKEAAALQKALEVAKEIEVPASLLSKTVVAAVAEQALKSVAELQMDVTAEVENLLLAPGVEGAQMVSTAGSEAMSGNTSTHSEPVIHIESDSNHSPSSSSTDSDDMLIRTLLKSIHSPSPSSKLHKKPTKPYEPMEPPVEVRISELLELRSSKLPPNLST